MATTDSTQDFAAKITYGYDASAHLSAAGRTISSATVTADNGALVTNTSHTTTAVLFKLDTTPVPSTAPLDVTVLVTMTLDNGDVDPRRVRIGVTNT